MCIYLGITNKNNLKRKIKKKKFLGGGVVRNSTERPNIRGLRRDRKNLQRLRH